MRPYLSGGAPYVVHAYPWLPCQLIQPMMFGGCCVGVVAVLISCTVAAGLVLVCSPISGALWPVDTCC